jgi:glycerol-3-phosphate dehydrogenase (NAD(P)+)
VSAPIGVVTGTPLGEALARRLAADGRQVIAGADDEAFRALSQKARLVVLDAPALELPALAARLGDFLDGNHLVAHCVRGLGPTATPQQVILEATAVRRVGVLAGPLLPADLDAGRPTAAVVASRHVEVMEEFAAALSTPRLRVYRSADPIGVELSSTAAGLVAFGLGVADGLDLGSAARALSVVRALRELERLVAALGGDPRTPHGLGGLGDLLVRATDGVSPPYLAGRAIARGEPPDLDALADVIETARNLDRLAGERRVQAHLFRGLGALLAGKTTPRDLLTRLMEVPVLDD